MRPVFPQTEPVLRILPSVANETELAKVKIKNVLKDGGVLGVTQDAGRIFVYVETSIEAVAANQCVVPNEIAATAAYLADPTTAPGRWVCSGGVGGGAGARTITYIEGGADSGTTIFNSWAKAYAAALAVVTAGGFASIYLDTSIGTPTTTAGTYNLRRISITGGNQIPATLRCVNGTVFQNFNYAFGVSFLGLSTTAPIFSTPTGTWVLNLEGGSSISTDPTATQPFISVGATTTLFLSMVAGAAFVGGGGAAVLSAVSGSTTVILRTTGSYIDSDTITGAGTVADDSYTSSGSISLTQTGALAFSTVKLCSSAEIAYTTTKSVKEALDALFTDTFKCRGIATSIAAYTGTGTGVLTGSANGALGAQDGLTYTAGQAIFLPKGLANVSLADAGPWVVTVVGDGSTKYVLTRPWWYAHGAPIQPGIVIQFGGDGTGVLSGTTWKTMCAAGLLVDTGDPLFFPGRATDPAVSMGGGSPTGVATTTKIPIWSANVGITWTRTTPVTPSLTVQYTQSAITPGALGTASVSIRADIAAGTANTADGSSGKITVINW